MTEQALHIFGNTTKIQQKNGIKRVISFFSTLYHIYLPYYRYISYICNTEILKQHSTIKKVHLLLTNNDKLSNK